MEKLILIYIGKDEWQRPVYQDQLGNLWKDTEMQSLKTKKVDKYNFCTTDEYEGEPDTPMADIKKYESIEVELKFN